MNDSGAKERLLGRSDDDPYYAFQDEITMRLSQTTNLLRKVQSGRGSAKEAASLAKNIRGLQANLGDLQSVVARVESQRGSFMQISDAELRDRKQTVRDMQVEVGEMAEFVLQSQQQSKHPPISAPSPDVELGRMNDYAQREQEFIEQEQDETLDAISSTLGNLQNIGLEMHEEIETQNVMLDELATDMDTLGGRMENALGRLDKL